jgi:long-chain acyl-CoA synthetase
MAMSQSTPVTLGIPAPGSIGRVAIGDIVRRAARRYPDRVALIGTDTRLTFATLDAEINRFANFLLSRGLTKGDRVATLCGNSWQFVVAMFGIQKAGLIWVPINTGLAPDDVRYILGHSEARFVVADDTLHANPALRRPMDELVGRGVLLPIAGNAGDGEMVAYADAIRDQPGEEPEVDIRDRDVAQIMYTSGTTGRPKGVMQSHLAVYIASLGNVIEMEARRDDVATALMPLFHCAQHILLCTFLHVGAATIVLRGFDAAGLLAAIARDRITWVFALPLMYSTILDHPGRATHDLSSLRYCLYAMAPMAEPLLRRLIAELCPNFALASGQTEIYPCTVFFHPEQQLQRFGSYWGESSLINDTAIMDDEGRLLPRGEIGEIVHRGSNVLEGYYKNPEATAEVRKFGWHHTGDLGMIDADGQLLFTDRRKDMIKTGGENVASIKVETALLRHPAVANAVAIGLPHPRWIEAVTAFVILKPSAKSRAFRRQPADDLDWQDSKASAARAVSRTLQLSFCRRRGSSSISSEKGLPPSNAPRCGARPCGRPSEPPSSLPLSAPYATR